LENVKTPKKEDLKLRNFVASNYLSVKSANPKFPFIIRECEGA
jgi:NADH dehydrogenase (ubiquinone) 1 alpha subcomplex subunit 2